MSAKRAFISVLSLAAAVLAPAPASASAPPGVAFQSVCAAPVPAGVDRCLLLVRTDIPQVKQSEAAPDQAPSDKGYGPADLQAAYNLPPIRTGVGPIVAIVDAYHDPNVASDLATYRAAWGLPTCDPSTGAGCVTEVNEHGAASPLPGPGPTKNGGWGPEDSIDVDMVSAICATCRILLVEANSATSGDLGSAVDSAVALGAQVVSNSYGGAYANGQSALNHYYNHPGVAVVAAAGDSGWGDPGFPASSPYVVTVGGTTLKRASNARGWTETVWSKGGSGCAGSEIEPKPAWQLDAVCSGRAFGDVAAVADPATGVAAYDTFNYGGWFTGAGTSVAAPIIAGIYALAGAPAPGTYPASYLYSHVSGLNDITSGSNGDGCLPHYDILCTAGPGYDGPTGWGTPNGLSSFTPNAPLVIGQISGSAANARLGGLNTDWIDQSDDATQVAVASDPFYGPLTGVISGGNAYVKEGGLNASWDEEMPDVTALAVSSDSTRGPLIGVISGGTAYVKQGSLTAPWVAEMTGVSQIGVANDARNNALIAVLTTSGDLYAKQGPLEANWVLQRQGVRQFAVASDAVNGPLIAVVTAAGADAKEGSLTADWVFQGQSITQVAVASDPFYGPLIGVVRSGAAYAKQGGLSVGWTLERPSAEGIAVSSDADTGPVIATQDGGVMYAKQGSLLEPWTEQASAVTDMSVTG